MVRADATVAMGTGHVMRCLALVQAWQDAGGRAVFAMSEGSPVIRKRLLTEGIEVVEAESRPGRGNDATHLAELAERYVVSWVVTDIISAPNTGMT